MLFRSTVTWLDKIREFCSKCAMEIYMKKRIRAEMEWKYVGQVALKPLKSK